MDNFDLVEFFASLGTDVYIKTNNGWNCLHISAQYGQLDLCRRLIHNHEFDVCMASNYGCTALHKSAENGNYKLHSFFADIRANIYLKMNNRWSCLNIAAVNGHLNICKALVDKHDFDVHFKGNDGWIALHHSAKSGSYELVSCFTNMGADIRPKTINGWSFMNVAAVNGHSNLCNAFVQNHGFNVYFKDNDGWTALHNSARSGSYELVFFFADMGAYIYLKINNGWSCLNIAAVSGHLNLCKTLEHKHDFDVQLRNNNG